MSEPSLFPNPPRQRRRKRRAEPDSPCCVPWLEFIDERQHQRRRWNRAEAMVHQLCHSRVPFSRAKVVQLAGCSQLTAAAAIRIAMERKWLAPVETYGEDDPTLYGGRLT